MYHYHHKARCHCGNIEACFETQHTFGELGVRACSCTFCRKHGARSASDPTGALSITVHDPDKLNRYHFGLDAIEVLLCRACGVYVAALFKDGDKYLGVLNVNSLTDQHIAIPTPVDMNYEQESREHRIERMRQRWMPVKELVMG